MDYFLRDKAQPEGPYDLMAIIRKIRNGAVSESTMLSQGMQGEMKPAGQLSELQEFFHSADTDNVIISHVVNPHSRRPQRTFSQILRQHLAGMLSAPGVAIYSGIYVVIWLLVGMLFMMEPNIIKSMIGVTCAYFIMGPYLYGIHRFVRGNPVRTGDIIAQTKASAVQLLLASLVVGFLMFPPLILTHYVLTERMLAVSLPIFFLVLFIILTFFAFVPLLIVQKKSNFMDAILESSRFAMANKGENLGLIFGLASLNFLLLPFLPIVLPITSTALAEMYEEHLG